MRPIKIQRGKMSGGSNPHSTPSPPRFSPRKKRMKTHPKDHFAGSQEIRKKRSARTRNGWPPRYPERGYEEWHGRHLFYQRASSRETYGHRRRLWGAPPHSLPPREPATAAAHGASAITCPERAHPAPPPRTDSTRSLTGLPDPVEAEGDEEHSAAREREREREKRTGAESGKRRQL